MSAQPIGNDEVRLPMNGSLSAAGISKRFGGVAALTNVDLVLQRGEVHGLVGENGAGKSTLIRILSGGLTPDRGSVHLDGHLRSHSSQPTREKTAW